jgi:hypothetical protein
MRHGLFALAGCWFQKQMRHSVIFITMHTQQKNPRQTRISDNARVITITGQVFNKPQPFSNHQSTSRGLGITYQVSRIAGCVVLEKRSFKRHTSPGIKLPNRNFSTLINIYGAHFGKIHFIAWLICKSVMCFHSIYETCDILKRRSTELTAQKSNKMTLMNNTELSKLYHVYMDQRIFGRKLQPLPDLDSRYVPENPA